MKTLAHALSPVHEERRISAEQPQLTAAHHTITTARRPDHIRLSALVRSRSTQFTAHPSCELGHGPPKRGHFSAILAGIFRVTRVLLSWAVLLFLQSWRRYDSRSTEYSLCREILGFLWPCCHCPLVYDGASLLELQRGYSGDCLGDVLG